MTVQSQTVRNLVPLGVFMALVLSLQADYYVARNGSNTNTPPYDSWANAASNIQTVVDYAPSGSTIWVGDGTYSALGKTNIVSLLSFKKSLTLRGNSLAPEQVVLNGRGTERGLNLMFAASDLTLELDGFTFSNCYATSSGGGISIGRTKTDYSGHSIVVRNCNFVENHVVGYRVPGGAVFIYDTFASPRTFDTLFSNCVFSANSAEAGGAGYLRMKSVTMVDCRAVGNVADGYNGGGAFWLYGCDVANLQGCTFLSNRCENITLGGGALYCNSTPSTLTDCRFEENEAIVADGGAILTSSSLFATNCVFLNNRANSKDKLGGAIFARTETPQLWLANCLVVGNLAGEGNTHAIHGATKTTGDYVGVNSTIVSNSGGVAVLGAAMAPTVEIRNSIIRYNQQANGNPYNYTMTGTNGLYKISNTATAPLPVPTSVIDGGGNTIADPKFVSLTGGNFHLQPRSPCIDTGLNQNWMVGTTDLDGRPRVDCQSQQVDMGCYEYQKSGTVLIIL